MSIAGAAPFSLQSPEVIAKQYEGNKQKIAQAVQLGLVDPTAGTLAGMFIDRMRAGAAQEHGAPPTVAQQVLGAHPPAPPAPPPGGPPMQGFGALHPPPSAPMAAPTPQGAPMAAPMGGPPVRAANGGLMSIPIPDQMFDEPENASMARGGLVAFGAGDSVDPDMAMIAPQDDSDGSGGDYGEGGGGGSSDAPDSDHAKYMAIQRARAELAARQHAYNVAHNGVAPPNVPPPSAPSPPTKLQRGLGTLLGMGAQAVGTVGDAYGGAASAMTAAGAVRSPPPPSAPPTPHPNVPAARPRSARASRRTSSEPTSDQARPSHFRRTRGYAGRGEYVFHRAG